MNDIGLVIGILIIFLPVIGIPCIVTYFLTKRSANKKIEEYKSIKQAIGDLTTQRKKLEEECKDASNKQLQISKETNSLQQLKANEKDFFAEIVKYAKQLSVDDSESTAQPIDADHANELLKKTKYNLNQLLGDLDIYSRLDEYVSYGHIETPQYLYETSARFAEEIKYIRQQQKDMITDKIAIIYPDTVTISDNNAFNKKVLDGQVKLMLTAFNIESDFLIGKVSPSNFSRILERIEKIANTIEKSAASLECGFNIDYIELKFEECKLQYAYTLKKEEEQAEQKLIREQIKEEQQALKEYRKAIIDAEKEENMYRKMLEQARRELSKASEHDKNVMEQRILDLEQQLQNAEANEARAKSMAEQTRKGYVYVISNIGSFGENIYKIGLTRRLEPMDRVKELGDASVPFSFDVHAMIYTDDAPALEASLHREFNDQRVNMVNTRKEFFRTELSEIKKTVEKISGETAEFKTTIAAEEYYESLRLQKSSHNNKENHAKNTV